MNNDSPYLTLSGITQHEIAPIKGSRFIGFALPVSNDEAAIAAVADIKAQYPDARHWCWAYQLREQQKTRFADDGEPTGSAGKPILAPIVGRELFDTMVIVVRYFGGVKLGVGGLVRAYSQTANAVLTATTPITVVPTVTVHLQYRYEDSGQVAAALATLALREENTSYTEQVCSELQITRENITAVTQTLTDYTAGKAIINVDE